MSVIPPSPLVCFLHEDSNFVADFKDRFVASLDGEVEAFQYVEYVG